MVCLDSERLESLFFVDFGGSRPVELDMHMHMRKRFWFQIGIDCRCNQSAMIASVSEPGPGDITGLDEKWKSEKHLSAYSGTGNDQLSCKLIWKQNVDSKSRSRLIPSKCDGWRVLKKRCPAIYHMLHRRRCSAGAKMTSCVGHAYEKKVLISNRNQLWPGDISHRPRW